MKRSLRLRPLARRDLAEIWHYTVMKWDLEQAENYVSNIEAELTNLRRHPSRGTDRSDLYPGLRKASGGAHRIYYLFDDTMIDVVRILHQRQDVETALRP